MQVTGKEAIVCEREMSLPVQYHGRDAAEAASKNKVDLPSGDDVTWTYSPGRPALNELTKKPSCSSALCP